MSKCCKNKALKAECRAQVSTLNADSFFYVDDSRGMLRVTWSFLQSLITNTVLGVAIIPKRVYVSGDYQAWGTEDEIYCFGDMTVTLPEISDSVKSPYINSNGGTVTIVASGPDSVQAGYTVIVDGDSGKYGPDIGNSEWRAL